MPNLRVVYNNAANRTSALTASTTAGTLAASNLLTDIKTEVWRSTGTTATLTATWTTTESVAMVALPFSNLTATATLRVQCYTLSSDSSAAYDSGNILCCPVALGFSAPWATGGANSNAYGGGVYATIWFPAINIQKVIITITDTSNPLGYVEAARLVVGPYWSPDRDAESDSLKVIPQDDSKHFRSESGSLWTDRGPMYRKLSFDLSWMSAADRNIMWAIMRGNGMTTSIFVSMLPSNSDSYAEQIYTIYGRLSSGSALQFKYQHLAATQVALEEI